MPEEKDIVILAFDASMDQASVGLWARGNLYVQFLDSVHASQDLAARFIPLMQGLLAAENLNFEDVDVIATPTGPGSFTGIRIGLATAQGLQLATPAAVFAPSTLEVMAFAGLAECEKTPETVFVSFSTRRNTFYTQCFDRYLEALSPGTVQTAEEISDFLANHSEMHVVETTSSRVCENLVLLYFKKTREGHTLPCSLRPTYVHNPEFVKTRSCFP